MPISSLLKKVFPTPALTRAKEITAGAFSPIGDAMSPTGRRAYYEQEHKKITDYYNANYRELPEERKKRLAAEMAAKGRGTGVLGGRGSSFGVKTQAERYSE